MCQPAAKRKPRLWLRRWATMARTRWSPPCPAPSRSSFVDFGTASWYCPSRLTLRKWKFGKYGKFPLQHNHGRICAKAGPTAERRCLVGRREDGDAQEQRDVSFSGKFWGIFVYSLETRKARKFSNFTPFSLPWSSTWSWMSWAATSDETSQRRWTAWICCQDEIGKHGWIPRNGLRQTLKQLPSKGIIPLIAPIKWPTAYYFPQIIANSFGCFRPHYP